MESAGRGGLRGSRSRRWARAAADGGGVAAVADGFAAGAVVVVAGGGGGVVPVTWLGVLVVVLSDEV